MKKVLTLLAIFAAVCLVSCNKEPEPAVITAGDVTVQEGGTVKIDAETNSTATITYSSDNTAVATVDPDGTVTGVTAGTANISLKVAAVKGAFTAAEKTVTATVTAKDTPDPSGKASIKIDGDFSDWAALPSGTFSQQYVDGNATHPALTCCKVYADTQYIYVYFEWDTDMIEYVPDVEHIPFHCYINTDGDASTGGFSDLFSDACSDVFTEGLIYGSDGIGSYDPAVYPWIGEPHGEGWGWGDAVLADGSGFGEGAGVEGKYEFSLKRSVLADCGFPVADVFSIGFDIYQNWDYAGILPSAAPGGENPASIQVTTQK